MKEGSLTREGGKEERAEEEAVKIKKPAKLLAVSRRSVVSSLTHSRGKSEATILRSRASRISHFIITTFKSSTDI